MKEFIQNHLDSRPEEDSHKKVLVVTHSLACKVWTENIDHLPDDYSGAPVNYHLVRN